MNSSHSAGEGLGRWAIRKASPDVFAPVLVLFRRCNECKLDTLALTNSPFYHTVFVKCNGITVTGVDIDSPTASKNTDGLSLYASKVRNPPAQFVGY
jgi:polygalacturonase